MTNDEVRETMLVNLRDWMLAVEADVELDSDPVSIKGFTDDEGVPIGGLALVRTPEAFKAIMDFAEREGLITPGKGIVDGTRTEAE